MSAEVAEAVWWTVCRTHGLAEPR